MITDWEIAVRLTMAGFLAALIGYERQARHKSAGLRTHMLVAIGSCLIMILSINIYSGVQGLTNADPARLAAQVVSGIGFLGAGSIIKEGPTIRGLTTAASLWVVSAVGLAVGSGYYISAALTTLLVFATLTILARYERKWYGDERAVFTVTTISQPGQIGRITTMFGRFGAGIRDIKMEESQGELTITFLVNLAPHSSVDEIARNVGKIEGIKSVVAGR